MRRETGMRKQVSWRRRAIDESGKSCPGRSPPPGKPTLAQRGATHEAKRRGARERAGRWSPETPFFEGADAVRPGGRPRRRSEQRGRGPAALSGVVEFGTLAHASCTGTGRPRRCLAAKVGGGQPREGDEPQAARARTLVGAMLRRRIPRGIGRGHSSRWRDGPRPRGTRSTNPTPDSGPGKWASAWRRSERETSKEEDRPPAVSPPPVLPHLAAPSTRGGSPVREIRSPGSIRGAARKGRPYRDRESRAVRSACAPHPAGPRLLDQNLNPIRGLAAAPASSRGIRGALPAQTYRWAIQRGPCGVSSISTPASPRSLRMASALAKSLPFRASLRSVRRRSRAASPPRPRASRPTGGTA